MTTLTVSDRSPSDVKADALVLATVRTDDGAALAPGHGLRPQGGRRRSAPRWPASTRRAPSRRSTACPPSPGSRAPLVVLVGLGPAPEDDAPYDPEVLRRAAGAAVRALTGRPKVALSLPGTTAEAVGAAAEGALFGAYEFAGHRGDSSREVRRQGGRAAGRDARATAPSAPP